MGASRRHYAGVLALALLLVGTAQGEATELATVSAWLERMNRAVRLLQYEGRFVYQHRDHLEALHIRHTVRDGKERERLVSLNGSPRQVVRTDDKVTCMLPQAQNMAPDRRAAGRGFSPIPPIRPEELAQHYRFEVGDRTRVAGRQAQIIAILPRDDLRYGYELALDVEHALPLRTTMVDSAGQLVSQIMFTELRVGDVSDEPHPAALPEIAAAAPDPAHKHGARAHLMKPTAWQFTGRPSGFMLNLHRRYAKPDGSADVEHFIFSDGLATVSVYVEAGSGEGLQGTTQAGPINAYGRRVDAHQVTVVGEVPPQTLRQLGENIVRILDPK